MIILCSILLILQNLATGSQILFYFVIQQGPIGYSKRLKTKIKNQYKKISRPVNGSIKRKKPVRALEGFTKTGAAKHVAKKINDDVTKDLVSAIGLFKLQKEL